MARFKPVNPDDPPRGRIDGFVYSPTRPTPVLRLWTYPLQHPSDRFDSFNGAARSLDETWDAMDGEGQGDWDLAADDVPDLIQCDIDADNPFWPPMVGGGQFLHRSVNLSRLMRGLSYTATPPTFLTEEDGDTLTPSWSGPTRPPWPPAAGTLTLTWARPGGDPGGDYFATVQGAPLNHNPEVGLTSRRYRTLQNYPILYGTALDVSDIFILNPGLYLVPFCALRVLIGETECCPFVSFRLSDMVEPPLA